jgi:hypothetical protein
MRLAFVHDSYLNISVVFWVMLLKKETFQRRENGTR